MSRGGRRPCGRAGRSSRSPRRIARFLVASLLAFVTAGFLPPPAAAAPLADGGFESGVLAGPFLPPMPPSFGQWMAETGSGRLVNPPNPVHTGNWAAVVDTMNASIGGVIIQDFDQGTTSYALSFWVYPGAGIEGVGLMYNWDRGVTGARDQGTAVGFTTTVTGLVAWDASVTLPPIAYGTWHRIEVVADKCTRTQDLLVDGIWWGSATASPAANIPSGNATVYFGDGSWIPNRGRFYWDDFAVTSWDCAASGPPDYVIANPNPAGPLVVGLSLSVALSVDVSNAGGLAPDASLLAFANGTTPSSPFAIVAVDPIAGGGLAGPFTATWTSPPTPGRYTVTALADSTDAIPEADETNNGYSWTIDVVSGPVTTLLVGSPNYTAGDQFVTSRTQLRFSVADPGGSGILRTRSRVDGSAWGDTSGAFVLLYEGSHTLEWFSEDRARNVEAPSWATLIVDDTPPTTTMAPAGDAFPATASFTFLAVDNASGVDRTEYRVDDGSWTTYASAFSLPPGTHRVRFRSVDHLGNQEPERSRVLTIAAETNWKPLVATLFALALAGVGAWSSRRVPLAVGGTAPSVAKAFAATVLPFVAAEGLTGVVSLLTGLLSIPPILGPGTAVDVGILAAGLAVSLLRARRRR